MSEGEQSSVKLYEGLDTTGVKRSKHPVWYPPTNPNTTGLQMMNSLTETVEPFAPRVGRQVKWYTCGPTVYDLSHMGHARAYLSFDILRRIAEDYFGYSVQYHVNVTDIDDKIIKRARVNKLLADYKKTHTNNFAMLDEKVKKAVQFAKAALDKRATVLSQPLPENANSRVKEEREEKLKEHELKTQQFTEQLENIEAARKAKNTSQLFDAAKGALGELLDQERGASITDQSIYDAHARYYEKAFFEDCRRLGIREPDCLTRVTDYVPQIVAFVGKIMENGFAYKGETSIFFDTEAFVKAGYSYPKLKSGGAKETTADEMAEGEGALSSAVQGEKRSENDFALWKFAKPGEPKWPAPWGEGRPGWHIECSVIASDILGDNIDIHAGGWDLKFPHHDNECAQSEAHFLHGQWVNYFIHCGHLHIKGLKMSKSLKNFITIRQALEEITPREMRLLFLQNEYGKPMNFSDQSLGMARETERVLRSFFGTVEIILRDEYLDQPVGYNEHDRELQRKWEEAEQQVHEALCNNMNTKRAMEVIMELVACFNKYSLSGERRFGPIVRKVGRFVTRMLQVFGVIQGTDEIGFSESQSSAESSKLVPVLDAVVKFRDDVRNAARLKKQPHEFIPLCDVLRDEYLPPHGIRLEDKPDGPTEWKNDDPNVLMREVAERKAAIEREQISKATNRLKTQEKLLAKWEQFVVKPEDYFRVLQGDKYKEFNAEGMPTVDATGEPVAEKKQQKLAKEVAKYAASHKELMNKGPTFLAELRQEVAELRAICVPAAAAAAAAYADPAKK